MIDEEEPDKEESVLLAPEASLQVVGQQIAAAESARNHVVFEKLGEHLDTLIAFLRSVSGRSR